MYRTHVGSLDVLLLLGMYDIVILIDLIAIAVWSKFSYLIVSRLIYRNYLLYFSSIRI